MSFGSEIKNSFKYGNTVTKLIYINLAVFIAVRLPAVICDLFNISGFDYMQYLQMPASLSTFAARPWTIVTYMFLHYDFLHILFNVLFLYWFGRLFLSYYNQKQLVGVYLLGGLFGGLFYLFLFNISSHFEGVRDASVLLGASASALAIAIAIAATAPNMEINLMFVGKVKLKYLALVMVGVDLLSVTSFNQGGHIAHLGGALGGYLFAVMMRKGKDMTSIINRMIDSFVSLFRRKSKMKISYKNKTTRQMTDYEYNIKKKKDREDIDAILDKIKQSGYDNLSAAEKKRLFDQSQK